VPLLAGSVPALWGERLSCHLLLTGRETEARSGEDTRPLPCTLAKHRQWWERWDPSKKRVISFLLQLSFKSLF